MPDIISGSFPGSETAPLEEAVSMAGMGTDAALIIGNGFAVVFTEAEKDGRNKYLLYDAEFQKKHS